MARAAGVPAAIPVPKGIELLDIADRETGLRGNPAPEAKLERCVNFRIQGPGGQGGDAVARLRRRQDPGLAGRNRHDRGIEAQGQAARHAPILPVNQLPGSAIVAVITRSAVQASIS